MLTQSQPFVNPGFDTICLSIVRSAGQEQQFHVQCERLVARVIDGPLGQGSIPATAIQDLRRHYEQQLRLTRDLAAAGMPTPPLDERPLLDLGQRVAEMLPMGIRQAIIAAVRRARRRMRSLRVVLEIADDAPELLRIPWELMALPLDWGSSEASFLFLNGDITLVRQLRGVGLQRPLEFNQPMRLQAFAAAPRDVRPIEVGPTQAAVRQVWQPHDSWYDGRNTFDALQERLRMANPHVVHLLCHGEQCDTGQSLPRYDLLLTHADGYTHRVSATDLARVLTLAHDLRLVLLQACYTGSVSVRAGERMESLASTSSVALALIRAGVPLVVAMQGEVAQPTAAAFVHACYATLGRGGCLGRAVAAGRVAMYAAGGMVDWSLPVIYQGNNAQVRYAWLERLTSGLENLIGSGLSKARLEVG